jgi:hypothetical protein
MNVSAKQMEQHMFDVSTAKRHSCILVEMLNALAHR